MSSFRVKHLRMRLQCERAENYESVPYTLEFPGSGSRKPFESPLGSPKSKVPSESMSPLKTITSPMSSTKKHSRYASWFQPGESLEGNKNLPWDENQSFLKPLNPTNFGLSPKYTLETASKTMNTYIEEDFKRYKSEKNAARKANNMSLPAINRDFLLQEEKGKEKRDASDWWKKQGESYVQIRKRYTEDHYSNLHSGTEKLNIQKNSSYRHEHNYNDMMKDMIKSMRPDNNHHSDDMNFFQEAYLRHRETLRK